MLWPRPGRARASLNLCASISRGPPYNQNNIHLGWGGRQGDGDVANAAEPSKAGVGKAPTRHAKCVRHANTTSRWRRHDKPGYLAFAGGALGISLLATRRLNFHAPFSRTSVS